jgi:hypothetical protein
MRSRGGRGAPPVPPLGPPASAKVVLGFGFTVMAVIVYRLVNMGSGMGLPWGGVQGGTLSPGQGEAGATDGGVVGQLQAGGPTQDGVEGEGVDVDDYDFEGLLAPTGGGPGGGEGGKGGARPGGEPAPDPGSPGPLHTFLATVGLDGEVEGVPGSVVGVPPAAGQTRTTTVCGPHVCVCFACVWCVCVWRLQLQLWVGRIEAGGGGEGMCIARWCGSGRCLGLGACGTARGPVQSVCIGVCLLGCERAGRRRL